MRYEEDTLDIIIKLVRQVVREEIAAYNKKKSNNIETYRHVKVVSSDEDTGLTNVVDMATNETITNVSNESGKTLSTGDIVRLYETNGNYCGKYIGLKCESGKE